MEEPQKISLSEEALKYSDIKISHVEHLSVIGYLTKAIEDAIIRRVAIMKYPLLLIDIPLLLAVLIVNLERLFYTRVVDYFLAHIRFDIKIITNGIKRLFHMEESKGVNEEEEEEDEYEETTKGKVFQGLRKTVRFLWGLFVLGMILPIYPLIFLYNIFIQLVIIGGLYYMLIFYHFPEWWGMILYFFTFCTVTFIVASISVPATLRTFIYVKYLFSLKRATWREINNEAKAAFLQFYLRIQNNRMELLNKAQPRFSEEEHRAEGGIYYLFLKTLHGIKDKFLNVRKRNISDLFNKIDHGVQQVTAELSHDKEEYERTVSQMTPIELFKTFIALVITFLISALLVTKGTSGQGIIGPLLLSFIDQTRAMTEWWNYQGSGIGYFHYLTQYGTFLPGLIKNLAIGLDLFFGYFFKTYYYILPIYTNFIGSYYTFYFHDIFASIFY